VVEKRINRRIAVLAGLDKSETLSQKNNKSKRVEGMAQAVEHLPRKHKAQNSNPSTVKILFIQLKKN
jgi:hypothetical protein